MPYGGSQWNYGMNQRLGMTLSEVREQRDVIRGAPSRHGARNVRIFGSNARGTSRSDSDVDLLVDLDPGHTRMDLGGLLMDMRSVMGARVDVAIDRMLRPEIRLQVLKDAIPL